MKRIIIELLDTDDKILAKYRFDKPDQYFDNKTRLASQSLKSTRQIIETINKSTKKKTEYHDVGCFLDAVKQAIEDIFNRSPSPKDSAGKTDSEAPLIH